MGNSKAWLLEVKGRLTEEEFRSPDHKTREKNINADRNRRVCQLIPDPGVGSRGKGTRDKCLLRTYHVQHLVPFIKIYKVFGRNHHINQISLLEGAGRVLSSMLMLLDSAASCGSENPLTCLRAHQEHC